MEEDGCAYQVLTTGRWKLYISIMLIGLCVCAMYERRLSLIRFKDCQFFSHALLVKTI